MADFVLANHGTIMTLRPNTEAAQAWLDANVEAEAWQWLGPSLSIEPRCAPALVQGIMDDGLSVE
jgi:hypothetical protein